jgi:PTS system glucitol/sorbitol-specific IIA component
MSVFLRSVITKVGPEVPDLLAGGVLILFADGAPEELAEVSVLHQVAEEPAIAGPEPGAELCIGNLSVILTGVGDHAWAKVRDIGHVVVNFNGLDIPERPGELCASQINLDALGAALTAGSEIIIRS